MRISHSFISLSIAAPDGWSVRLMTLSGCVRMIDVDIDRFARGRGK